jgi:hypothetical protein
LAASELSIAENKAIEKTGVAITKIPRNQLRALNP